MTISEIFRESKGIAYRISQQRKDQATFDYTQAVLIGRIMGTVLSGKGKVPRMEEVYGFVYTEEELQEMKNKANREKIEAFMRQFNARYEKGE